VLGTTRHGHRHTPSLDRGIGDGMRYLGRDSLWGTQAQPRLCGRRSRHCRKSCFQSLCSRQRRTAAPSPPLAGRLLGPTVSDPRHPSNRTNDRSLRSPVSFLLCAAAATDCGRAGAADRHAALAHELQRRASGTRKPQLRRTRFAGRVCRARHDVPVRQNIPCGMGISCAVFLRGIARSPGLEQTCACDGPVWGGGAGGAGGRKE
jgi:hypothetical protein